MMFKKFRFPSLCIALAAASASPAPVHAQYDFWAGQINNAQQAQISTISTHVDNLILQEVVDQQPRSERSNNRQGVAPSRSSGSTASFADVYPRLDFRNSAKVRDSIIQSLIDQTRRGDAEAGREIEKLFRQDNFLQTADSILSTYGMKTNNLADAYSVWMVNMYSSAHDDNRPTSVARMKAVRDQVARSFSSLPQFVSAPDSQKQAISDELLLRGLIIGGGLTSLANDPAAKSEFIDNVRQTARKSGFDVDAVTLTDEGFIPKGRKGADASDAVSGKEETALAAAAKPADASAEGSTNYALIAGAGGLGLGLAFLLGKAMGKKG
jgi:hypothetical protein